MNPALKKSLRYVLLIGVVIYLLANQDFQNIVRRCLSLRTLKSQSLVVDKEYENMREEKQRILHDDAYLEKIARRDLKMAKPGELDFRFQPPKPAAAPKK